MRGRKYEDLKLEYKNSKSKDKQEIYQNTRKIVINNIEDFKELLSISEKFNKSFFYRGQAYAKGNLRSTYARYKFPNYAINEGLLTNIINIGKEQKKYLESIKINKKGLELLSEMQHLGLKTPLIDFTSDIYNAVGFAIKDDFNEIEKEYFSIFILEKKDISYEIKNIEGKNHLYACPKNITRGISQKSYFILENQNGEENDSIIGKTFKTNKSNFK